MSLLLKETVAALEEKLGTQLDWLTVADVAVGVFFTGVVLETGHAGMAATPIREIPEAVCCPRSLARMPEAGSIRGRLARDLLPFALDRNVLKRAIGVATLNALSHLLEDKAGADGYLVTVGRDALDALPIGTGTKVVLVGAFEPYIRRLRQVEADFCVVEKNPETLRGVDRSRYRSPEAARDVFAGAEVAILTGSALVNHTMDALLDAVSKFCRIAVAGPTASLFPLPLFARGVEVVGGIRITDPALMVRILTEGGSGHHLRGECGQKMVMTPA
ncbi:MAG: DUF364 domain-containing protein [Candidatus Rokubacteria bacterium]|nr:DUF364 domain-containing protein [Candidatus Rokubacteria bacterium]